LNKFENQLKFLIKSKEFSKDDLDVINKNKENFLEIIKKVYFMNLMTLVEVK